MGHKQSQNHFKQSFNTQEAPVEDSLRRKLIGVWDTKDLYHIIVKRAE